ncbi:cytochrome P450 [Micromonospora echinofusca]|uniref:Cytochrome P450 n=1 Tax=Micromonospora echinofusca TaxID=47858 RepID=A0ABS3VMC1_MICEH|nr:cytochrome P450 [Micromonospora echinofusca]MBO4205657.1 cytochrome P450 [Micromonospora echinofusca]
MTATATTDLPMFPPEERPRGPFEILRDEDRKRWESNRVSRVRLPTGGWAWLLTRHADVRQLLRNPYVSSDSNRPGFPLLRELLPPDEQDRRGAFIVMDGAEHARLRRMLTAEFMIKNIRRIEPLIRQTVVDALDAMRAAGPPADLVTSFALPVPSMVICHLLGVPYADHDFFQSRSGTLLDRTAPLEDIRSAIDELRGYLRDLVDAKRTAVEPGDDLLSRLATERVATGELEPEELVGVALLLLVAGHETTANMIGLSTLLLLQHPEQFAALRERPEQAEDLVEELLRYLSVIRTGLLRVAVRDIEIAGQLIRAGDGVIGMLSLANRDPEVFTDPEGFGLSPAAHQHLAFGFGVHQCIGQPLARAELRIALVELAHRFPGLALTVDPADVPVRDNSVVYGVTRLPVTW